MIVVLAAMAAAQMAPPQPVKPWIEQQDYFRLVMSEKPSASLVRVIVSPSGKPEACTVTWSTGNARMDQLSCSLTLRRSRFSAARDDSGRPAWGEFQQMINFYLPDGRETRFPMGMRPDLDVTVKELPGSAAEAIVKLIVAVDQAGGLAACAGDPGADARLAAVACGQIKSAWETMPAVDSAGAAIPYVAARAVRFRTERSGRP